MIKLKLKKNESRRILNGHPWVFSNELQNLPSAEKGVLAQLYDDKEKFIAVGHYNPHSLISFRLVSRLNEDIDSVQFFESRIQSAIDYRKNIYPDLETLRLVYGESDHLPGLVVDKYGDYLSLQLLSAGMDKRRELIVEALLNVLSPKGIIARNDVSVRSLEGLPESVETIYGEIPDEIEIKENELRFIVNPKTGQKTGTFLDQKDNRMLLRNICDGKDVLDAFCYHAGWGIHAAFYGASSVLATDISAKALEHASRNAALNGVADKVTFDECDVFEKLRQLKSIGKKFDVVVMDPPAFIKSRKNIAEGTKGYLTVNMRAMELIKSGGYLISCSCSHHLGREAFREMLTNAAIKSGSVVRLIDTSFQPPDHPVLLSFPESEYLKCYLLQVL